jgi:hypothetical protein
MLLSQILNPDGSTSVVARDGSEAAVVRNTPGTHALANESLTSLRSLSQVVASHGLGQAVDLPGLAAHGRITLPITPPLPPHPNIMGRSAAQDTGTLPQLAAIHVVGPEGLAVRMGWALALPTCAGACNLLHGGFGPEILLGELPDDLRGTLRIRRGGEIAFETSFRPDLENILPEPQSPPPDRPRSRQTGRMGEVHLYLFPVARFGPETGFAPETGDTWEIEATAFGLPLRSPFAISPAPRQAVAMP